MSYQPHTTPSGFVLPSIHSFPPFFTRQRHEGVLAEASTNWIKLILSYAQHHGLWNLRVEDASRKDGDWAPVFHNPRINRELRSNYLQELITMLVAQQNAIWDPPNQVRSVILCWKRPDEWAEVLFDWTVGTGQLNTILTFFEISSPDVTSPLTGIPLPLLQHAIGVLVKTGRAQLIEGAEGGGVRLFQR